MKEKAPREVAAARKPAAAQAGARPPGHEQPADALQQSPAMAAQRRQLELLGKAPSGRPVQRVKSKPTDDELAKLVAEFVSNKKGTCNAMTEGVHAKLREFVDSGKEVGAVLLTWAENLGTDDFDVGDHTAAMATWAEGTFVVDTTCSQFGGPAVFIGSVADWVSLITGLQGGHKVSHVQHELLAEPIGASAMRMRSANRAYDLMHPEKDAGGAKEGKNEGKDEGKKKDKDSGKGAIHKSSRCYLTSACVEYHGLADDCHELTVLRAFRDGWLSAQPGGLALIEEYYRIAPAIVDAIEAAGLQHAIYGRVFAVVRSCVASIEAHRPSQAMQAYRALVETLQTQLLPTQPKEEFHGQ